MQEPTEASHITAANPPDLADPWALDPRLRAVLATGLYLSGGLLLPEAARLAAVPEEEFVRLLEAAGVGAPAAAPGAAPVIIPAGFKLSVLMPVYNERATLLKILTRVRSVKIPKEVLVVDDGSTDGTRELLRTEVEGRWPEVRVFYHSRNMGKGAALRTAIPHATGDVCLIQDADLEYDPQEYPRLLAPILDGRADAVFGSRFLGGPHRVLFFWHYLGNQVLTSLSNMFTNLNLTDMETCYKVCRTELLQSLALKSCGFEIEPEITAKLARCRARIYEVPISYSGRDYSEGKKIGWRDGIKALISIMRYRLCE
ncbi:MAG: glycosyltransferase family 2 protein [Armatimonadetes bacterium]|nr:glycosyltransferase family 2 protein [Armatimonadota bacterium]